MHSIALRKTDFRKYSRPARRFSRNVERNLWKRLFGGMGGREVFELGNVAARRSLRVSNSEYLQSGVEQVWRDEDHGHPRTFSE